MKPPNNILGWDTETTGLNRRRDNVFAYSLIDTQEKIDIRRFDGSPSRVAMAEHKFARVWGDSKTPKVAHHAKFDIGMTERKLGKVLPQHWEPGHHVVHCTYLMSKILRNNHYSHGLDDLCWELAGYKKDDDRAIRPYVRGGGCYQDVPEDLMTAYQKADAERGLLLWLFFSQKIWADKNLLEVYEYERKLLHVTLRMEDEGLMIYPDVANKLIADTSRKANAALDDIQRLSGERLRPGTSKFRDYIYGKAGVPVIKKTSSGLPSLRKDVVAELYKKTKNPLLEAAQRYASFSHTVSTIRGYLERRDANDKIHPTINTCEAITLRESCSDPNLQNTKRPEAIEDNPYYVNARSAFGPDPEHVLFFVDYDGQEARVLVHYSKDQLALNIINNVGPDAQKYSRKGKGDFHTLGACCWYGMEYMKIDGQRQKDFRTKGKNTTFAKAYGAQFYKLAATAGLPLNVIGAGIKRFETALPKLAGMCEDIARQVRECGYVTTEFGNRLYIPHAEAYMGVNHLVQHTGVGMIKRAQVNIAPYLAKATGGEAKLVLAIHDEIIIKYPRKRLSEAKHVMRGVVERMVDLGGRFSVPFEGEVSITTTDWSAKKEFSLHG